MLNPEFLTYWFSSRCPFGDDVLVAKIRPCTLVENKQPATMSKDDERIELDLVCNSLQCILYKTTFLFFSIGSHLSWMCCFFRLLDQPNPMGHQEVL